MEKWDVFVLWWRGSVGAGGGVSKGREVRRGRGWVGKGREGRVHGADGERKWKGTTEKFEGLKNGREEGDGEAGWEEE